MLIEIKKLSKSYRIAGENKTVLNDFDFSLDVNEFLAIKGKSGCGKSTLLRILGLMDTYDSGSYTFCGIDTNRLSDKKAAELRNREI